MRMSASLTRVLLKRDGAIADARGRRLWHPESARTRLPADELSACGLQVRARSIRGGVLMQVQPVEWRDSRVKQRDEGRTFVTSGSGSGSAAIGGESGTAGTDSIRSSIAWVRGRIQLRRVQEFSLSADSTRSLFAGLGPVPEGPGCSITSPISTRNRREQAPVHPATPPCPATQFVSPSHVIIQESITNMTALHGAGTRETVTASERNFEAGRAVCPLGQEAAHPRRSAHFGRRNSSRRKTSTSPAADRSLRPDSRRRCYP